MTKRQEKDPVLAAYKASEQRRRQAERRLAKGEEAERRGRPRTR